MMRLLITGGAGFIGSNFVRLVKRQRPGTHVVVLDALTYAGNLDNLTDALASGDAFVHMGIHDPHVVDVLKNHHIDTIVHFAAESHVDRSILSPTNALDTNVMGTAALLDAARHANITRFLHVSTDEVYGDVPDGMFSHEKAPFRPSSPYAASKAAAEHLAFAYMRTYGLPVVVTRGCNTYGPYQFPEKLIPLMIHNALKGAPLPVYGDGLQVREWLYVEDHCRGILTALEEGTAGEAYNIGIRNGRVTNLDLIHNILWLTGANTSLIHHVEDRPGHDRRYAMDTYKTQRELGWHAETDLKDGLALTVQWYKDNAAWVERVTSGEYQTFYATQYGNRL
jgi:dTDP-glucose 4,6-dehydratase